MLNILALLSRIKRLQRAKYQQIITSVFTGENYHCKVKTFFVTVEHQLHGQAEAVSGSGVEAQVGT